MSALEGQYGAYSLGLGLIVDLAINSLVDLPDIYLQLSNFIILYPPITLLTLYLPAAIIQLAIIIDPILIAEQSYILPYQ